MGGVQFSTLYFATELLKDTSISFKIILPRFGLLSEECQNRCIPYSVKESILDYKSTSISFFNDKIRLPNPFILAINVFRILINARSFQKIISENKPNVVLTKGLLNHITAGLSCKILGVPIIWHLQDLISGRIFGFYRILFQFISKNIPEFIKLSPK